MLPNVRTALMALVSSNGPKNYETVSLAHNFLISAFAGIIYFSYEFIYKELL